MLNIAHSSGSQTLGTGSGIVQKNIPDIKFAWHVTVYSVGGYKAPGLNRSDQVIESQQ